MLTLSKPVAPLLRLTALKAFSMISSVICPVNECALNFFIFNVEEGTEMTDNLLIESFNDLLFPI